MKKNINSLIICLIAVFTIGASSCAKKFKPVLSSQKGINFSILSLEQAKQKAKTENKPLFIFTHATWCPTCKKMEQEVLIQKKLGDTFNKDFVNVAIDLDGPEGHKLNDQYPIKATPTLFFFKADGSIGQKIEGFTTASELLTEAGELNK